MIQISRTTNPVDVNDMIPHFVLPVENFQEQFATQVVEMMTRSDVLVLVAKSDQSKLVGFIIAQAAADDRVFIHQAWASPKSGWELATALHRRIMLWAVSLDKARLEVRTQRSAEAMYRRFGFEESAKILTQVIPEDFTQRVLESTLEVSNG